MFYFSKDPVKKAVAKTTFLKQDPVAAVSKA